MPVPDGYLRVRLNSSDGGEGDDDRAEVTRPPPNPSPSLYSLQFQPPSSRTCIHDTYPLRRKSPANLRLSRHYNTGLHQVPYREPGPAYHLPRTWNQERDGLRSAVLVSDAPSFFI